MNEIKNGPSNGYELADNYIGKFVRVYLHTGVTLSGKLVRREGKFFLLQNDRMPEPACINMDAVSSLT
jgi:predicted TIM-barrel enzyme